MVEKRTFFPIYKIIVILALIITIIPFLWTFLTSLKTYKDIMLGSFSFTPTVANYKNLFFERGSDFPRYAINSLVIASISTTICVLIGSFSAYSVSRFKFAYHIDKILLGWIIAVQMLHPMAMVIPIFVIEKSLGLYDTYLGLILVYTTINLPFAIWMMKDYIDELPVALEEAAMIDGCDRLRLITNVVFPLIKPGFVATIIFLFMLIWNEFLFALILTSSADVMTLPPGMARLSQQYFIKYGEMGGAAIFSAVPVIILVAFIQKHLVRGLTMGALKG